MFHKIHGMILGWSENECAWGSWNCMYLNRTSTPCFIWISDKKNYSRWVPLLLLSLNQKGNLVITSKECLVMFSCNLDKFFALLKPWMKHGPITIHQTPRNNRKMGFFGLHGPKKAKVSLSVMKVKATVFFLLKYTMLFTYYLQKHKMITGEYY